MTDMGRVGANYKGSRAGLGPDFVVRRWRGGTPCGSGGRITGREGVVVGAFGGVSLRLEMKWLFGRKEKQPANKAALDQLTLQQLAKAGGNLEKPTDVVNYLYLPTEQVAQQAGTDLRQAGYSVEVRPAAKGSKWLALARIDLVPSDQNIQMLRERFEALAVKCEGEYDGWEAAVTQ